MTLPPKLRRLLEGTIPWSINDDGILSGFSLFLRRNLSKYPFPKKLSEREQEEIIQALFASLYPIIDDPEGYSLEEKESASFKELLQERFVCSSRDLLFPNLRSTLHIFPNKQLMIQVIGQDHLEVKILGKSAELPTSYETLLRIDQALHKRLHFAFSSRFGYQTSDFTRCGTGLTLKQYLHLPALVMTNKLEMTLSSIAEEGVVFSSIEGNLDDILAHVLIVSNRHTLGMSEEEIIQIIQKASHKICEAEKTVRAHLRKHKTAAVYNLVGKHFGIGLHSYSLSVNEALQIVSFITLGISLGWIEGVSEDKLIPLFFSLQRGHLRALQQSPDQPESCSQEQSERINQLRATELKEALKEAFVKE